MRSSRSAAATKWSSNWPNGSSTSNAPATAPSTAGDPRPVAQTVVDPGSPPRPNRHRLYAGDATLTYDFPAEHWKHLRTTNPIESTFATIRLRHRKTKGSGSRRASLAMMFKLGKSAEKRWRKLNGHEQLTLLIQGKTFTDGVLQDAA